MRALVRALAFYAEPEHYVPFDDEEPDVLRDNGEHAREALREVGIVKRERGESQYGAGTVQAPANVEG